METLINNINLTPAEKKRTLDDLDGWKQKGMNLTTSLKRNDTFKIGATVCI